MDQHDERLSTLREESAQSQEDLAGSRCFTVCVLVNSAKNQRINSLVGVVLCCHAHVSQSTATYCNTLRKEPTTCFWYEATGWLIVPVLDDVQGTQKELNSLQMLIGQHDERLSTLQKESVQYQKDVPGSH